MFNRFIEFIAIILLVSGCSTANLQTPTDKVQPTPVSQEANVKGIISKEEKNKGIPQGILNSIAAVESKHTVYAVNVKRKPYMFKTKEEAVKFVNASIDSGCKNISVGCLQLHYNTHKQHFSSVSDMLTPENNISYAASLLKKLYDKYGSWEMAIRMYHTNKARYNKAYYTKVMREYNSVYKAS